MKAVAVWSCISLVVLEALSYVVVVFVLVRRYPDYFAKDYTNYLAFYPDGAIQSFVERMFDPDLGWTLRPGYRYDAAFNSAGEKWWVRIDEKGSRKIPFTSQTVRVSLYGDSYAFGDEINANQSWQYYLSVLTNTKVENYGVSAYAPDQAVLKLEKNLRRNLGTGIIVLGMWNEDLKRMMSSYKGYFVYHDSSFVLGFKPVYTKVGDGYQWVLPRIENPTSRDDIEVAMKAARKTDYFYRLNSQVMPSPRFPYFVNLCRMAWYVFQADVLGKGYLKRYGGNWDDLWALPEAHDRFAALIDHFIELSKRYRFQPVIVFFPEPGQLQQLEENPKRILAYQRFARELQDHRQADGLKVIDIAQADFSRQGFNIKPFYAHPSQYGNKVIATHVFEALKDLPALADATAANRAALNSNYADSAGDSTPENRGVHPLLRALDAGSGTCATKLFQLGPRFPIEGIVRHDVTLSVTATGVRIHSTTSDPYLVFPQTPSPAQLVVLDYDTPVETAVEIYTADTSSGFTSEPVRLLATRGRNKMNVWLDNSRAFRLRFDPGTYPGDYVVRNLVVYSGCTPDA